MTDVAVRDLRNNTAGVIDRVRRGEDITITVNGVPTARLVPIAVEKRPFLTTPDLLALRGRLDTMPPSTHWEHEFEGDTTDELGSIR